MKIKRELITYLISGVVTTGVNYLLYCRISRHAYPLPCRQQRGMGGRRTHRIYSEPPSGLSLRETCRRRTCILCSAALHNSDRGKCAAVAAHKPAGHSRFSGKISCQRDHRDRELCIV